MRARRQYRDPRPGEIMTFLAMRAKSAKSMGNMTGKGNEVRVNPAPCCDNDKPSNPSLQINDTTGLWRCFRCGKTGNWFTLTREYGFPLSEQDRYKEYVPQQVNLNHIAKLAKGSRRPVTGNQYPTLLEYCKNRFIEPETLHAWRVSSFGKDAMRWPIFAVYDNRWTMVNSRCRRIFNRENPPIMKNGQPLPNDWFEVKGGITNLLIGNHLLKNDQNTEKRCIITEGQWDAMMAWQMGFDNAFSLPNGSQHIDVNGLLRYIPEDWEIWLAMDMDEAGHAAKETFFRQLGSDKVAFLELPYKDLNDWVKADQSVNMDKVKQCLKGFTKSVAVSNKKFVSIDMDEDEDEEENKIIAWTPWEGLNKLLAGGFREGQTTGVLAPSGVGKTTWCNQVCTFNGGKLNKVGIISLEGTRAAYTKKLKCSIRGQWEQQHWHTVISNLEVSELEGKEVTYQQCIEEMEIMASKGCKLFVLDNLDFITGDFGNIKAKAYGEIIAFAKRTKTHVIVVWQPNKIDRTTIVNSGNQKGYSQTFQDADNYLNLNVLEDFVRLEVEKSREEGVDRSGNKNMAWFIYDKDTRCFSEVKENIESLLPVDFFDMDKQQQEELNYNPEDDKKEMSVLERYENDIK